MFRRQTNVPISSSTCGYLPENRSDSLNHHQLEGKMDAELFEGVALPLFDQLYNLAHWLTGDRADAEDLVQETYAKALKGIKSFQEGTNFRAWMYRILRNTFLTSRSGLKAQTMAPLDDDDTDLELVTPHDTTPEVLLLQKESEQKVMDALASMPVQ